jgi:hypothetical protein
MIRTEKEILDKFNTVSDLFSIQKKDLLDFLPFDIVKPFLEDEYVKKVESGEEHWGTNISPKSRILEYLPFAYEKAEGLKGMSAARCLLHFKSWIWLDNNDFYNQISHDLDNYQNYGIDVINRIANFYGYKCEVDLTDYIYTYHNIYTEDGYTKEKERFANGEGVANIFLGFSNKEIGKIIRSYSKCFGEECFKVNALTPCSYSDDPNEEDEHDGFISCKAGSNKLRKHSSIFKALQTAGEGGQVLNLESKEVLQALKVDVGSWKGLNNVVSNYDIEAIYESKQ